MCSPPLETRSNIGHPAVAGEVGCYGIPFDTDAYVAAKLNKKVVEVAGGAIKTTVLMEGGRQSLWTILGTSLKFQFEYRLGLCNPSDVRPAVSLKSWLLFLPIRI